MANYMAALEAVNGNEYYAYSRSLKLVQARNYRNLGYLAKELLVKLNNEEHLNNNKVFEQRPHKARLLDKMVARYLLDVVAKGDDNVLRTDTEPKFMICTTLTGVANDIMATLKAHAECFT